MKVPTEAQKAAWNRHVEWSKRAQAARTKLQQSCAKTAEVHDEDNEYVVAEREDDDDYVVV